MEGLNEQQWLGKEPDKNRIVCKVSTLLFRSRRAPELPR
jgi:hypothetical protein